MAEENPSNLKDEIPELALFDPFKKKKKKKVVIQDPNEEVDKLVENTANLSVADTVEPNFDGMKKKKKKPEETDFLIDDKENFDDGADAEYDQIGEDEEGEGIVLASVRYPWEGTDRNYRYDELLDRVFNILRENNPDLAGDRRRTVMRPPQVLREGTKKTVFVNLMDLCKTMHRQPEHVMMFLLAEMGTSGSLDGQQRLVVKGRFAPKNFEGILEDMLMNMSYAMDARAQTRCSLKRTVCSFCVVSSVVLLVRLLQSRLALLPVLAAVELGLDLLNIASITSSPWR